MESRVWIWFSLFNIKKNSWSIWIVFFLMAIVVHIWQLHCLGACECCCCYCKLSSVVALAPLRNGSVKVSSPLCLSIYKKSHCLTEFCLWPGWQLRARIVMPARQLRARTVMPARPWNRAMGSRPEHTSSRMAQDTLSNTTHQNKTNNMSEQNPQVNIEKKMVNPKCTLTFISDYNTIIYY